MQEVEPEVPGQVHRICRVREGLAALLAGRRHAGEIPVGAVQQVFLRQLLDELPYIDEACNGRMGAMAMWAAAAQQPFEQGGRRRHGLGRQC